MFSQAISAILKYIFNSILQTVQRKTRKYKFISIYVESKS